MPSRKQHSTNGALVSGLLEFFFDALEQGQRIEKGQQSKYKLGQALGRTLIASTAGSVGGKLPDVLEPAAHPNHRKFLHSKTVLTATGYGIFKVSLSRNGSPYLKRAARGMLTGYSLHLVEDSFTPKGINFI